MNGARRAVCLALMRQERDGYSNLVLAHALRQFEGDARDKAFVSAVFYGTVERQITLDYLLQKFLKQPVGKLDAEVRAVLRSALYQARWMDSVPPSAAVNEAVRLTRGFGKSSAAAMVNAVLRRACAVELAQEPFRDEIQRFSVLYSVSPQIAALLRRAWPAEAEEILRAALEPPRLCVRVNTLRTSQGALEASLSQRGIETARGSVPECLFLTSYRGAITAEPAFQQGLFHVQGEASQLVCAALAPKPGETVIDFCAAPGGKSATLAQYLENRGLLLACDAVESRLSLIEQTFSRLGVACGRVLHNDASVPNEALPQADCVLCDVPCSGLGVLAKKPDIRQKNLEGLSALTELQYRILCTAARSVKPGGRLAYSTCTLNPEENEAVVRRFLQTEGAGFVLQTPQPCLEGQREIDGMITLFPFLAKTDGFFVALLQKM